MVGDDAPLAIDQDGVGEAELSDAGGDLRYLRLRVSAGVARAGYQIRQGSGFVWRKRRGGPTGPHARACSTPRRCSTTSLADYRSAIRPSNAPRLRRATRCYDEQQKPWRPPPLTEATPSFLVRERACVVHGRGDGPVGKHQLERVSTDRRCATGVPRLRLRLPHRIPEADVLRPPAARLGQSSRLVRFGFRFRSTAMSMSSVPRPPAPRRLISGRLAQPRFGDLLEAQRHDALLPPDAAPHIVQLRIGGRAPVAVQRRSWHGGSVGQPHWTPPWAAIAHSRMASASASLSSAGVEPRARMAPMTASLSALPSPVAKRLIVPTGTS